jgi:hypothetical protein
MGKGRRLRELQTFVLKQKENAFNERINYCGGDEVIETMYNSEVMAYGIVVSEIARLLNNDQNVKVSDTTSDDSKFS